VGRSGDPEEISVARGPGVAAAASPRPPRAAGAAQAAVVRVEAGPAAAGGEVVAAVPARYCAVAVRAAGGAVAVAGVREAALRVASGGGAVALGRVQATDVAVDAGPGGAIEAREVSGMTVSLEAGGGVRGGRLVGREVDVRGAPIAFEAALGASIVLDTRGVPAAVEARTLSADASLLLDLDEGGGGGGGAAPSEGGRVFSHGGPVALGAVAGSVAVHSGGGAVEAHCTLECRELEVRSGGGDVRCTLAPGADALVDIAGAASVAVEGAALRLGPEAEQGPSPGGGEGLQGSLSVGAPSEGRVGRGGRGGGPAPAGAAGQRSMRLIVRPEGGRVVLRERSWFESLRPPPSPAPAG